MKKWIILIIAIGYISFIVAINNPSAVYCEELGYDFISEKTSSGDVGFCLVEGNKFNAWDFFYGKVGQEYSYCASIGLETKTVANSDGSFSSEYANCINQTNGEEELQEELMELDKKVSKNNHKDNEDDEFLLTGLVVEENKAETNQGIINLVKHKIENSESQLLIYFLMGVFICLIIGIFILRKR